MDCSPPGSSVHGILQARILERGRSLLQGIFLTQESQPGFPALQADSLLTELRRKPLKKEMTIRYSCLENAMDRGACRAIVHGVANSRRRLSD